MDQPSFYAIIPATVRYCKELEPAAKLLYGEITALSNMHGYCFATNQYFADLYGVHITTVQEWLKSLKAQKFITIEVEIEGIQRKRKIWVTPEVQKMFTKQEKSYDVTGNLPSRHRKKGVYINTPSNTSKDNTPPTPQGEVREFGQFVRLSDKDLETLNTTYGKEQVLDMIDQINDHILSTGRKPYSDYAATLRTWFRRRKEIQKTGMQNPTEKNKEMAQKIISKIKHPDIELKQDCILFINNGAGVDIDIAYKDFLFRDKVLGRLTKMGLPIEGL